MIIGGKLSGISGNIDFKATGPPADIPIAIMSNFLSLSFFISFSFNIFLLYVLQVYLMKKCHFRDLKKF